ncbi:MAG: hypothetical protein ABI229_02290, partial [Gemmatimonadaceae bacterium]
MSHSLHGHGLRAIAASAILGALIGVSGSSLEAQQHLRSATPDTTHFTHADTLRGSNTPERAWWDATFYDLHVAVNPSDSSISGYNGITYRVTAPAR